MKKERLGWVLLGALVLSGLVWLLRQWHPPLPRCLFHDWTGLHCAGCGMTRATYALLDGRLADAFRFNPLGMILLPLVGIGIGLELLGWVRGKQLPFRFEIGSRGAWVLGGVVLAFWILRNCPVWPFTLLVPP